jgi:hypothetical protein
MEIFFLLGQRAGETFLVEFVHLDPITNVMTVEYKGKPYSLEWNDYNSYYIGGVDNTAGYVL